MNNNWRDETCEKCVYRTKYNGRRFPPVIEYGGFYSIILLYKDESSIEHWQKACAEYKEETNE